MCSAPADIQFNIVLMLQEETAGLCGSLGASSQASPKVTRGCILKETTWFCCYGESSVTEVIWPGCRWNIMMGEGLGFKGDRCPFVLPLRVFQFRRAELRRDHPGSVDQLGSAPLNWGSSTSLFMWK